MESATLIRHSMKGVSNADAKRALAQYASLVNFFAKKAFTKNSGYYGWLDFEDLVSFGQIAVVEALATYDPTKGAKEATWVSMMVRHTLFAIKRISQCKMRTTKGDHAGVKRVELATKPPAHAEAVPGEIYEEDLVYDNDDASAEELAVLQAQREWFQGVLLNSTTIITRVLAYGPLSEPELATHMGRSRQRLNQRKRQELVLLQGIAVEDGWIEAE